MKPRHLSELQIQEYALQNQPCEPEVAAHLHSCEHCRARVEVYKIVLSPIKEARATSFDFDLCQLVIQVIQTKSTKRIFPMVPLVITVAFTITLISVILFLLSKNNLLNFLQEGGNHIITYTLITGGVLIVAFQVTDLILRFGEQAKDISVNNYLQQNSKMHV